MTGKEIITAWKATGWEHPMGKLALACLEDDIAAAVQAEREACAELHASIDPRCDHERQRGDPGAGAMGAIVAYRDAIRARRTP